MVKTGSKSQLIVRAPGIHGGEPVVQGTRVPVRSIVLSLENDPRKIAAWRANIAEAGLEDCADLIEGDAAETIPGIDDVFDVVFLDAEKEDYDRLFQAARGKLEPGALVVADNVLSHGETLGAYTRARQSDPTLESVTVPLDRGLELSVILHGDLGDA